MRLSDSWAYLFTVLAISIAKDIIEIQASNSTSRGTACAGTCPLLSAAKKEADLSSKFEGGKKSTKVSSMRNSDIVESTQSAKAFARATNYFGLGILKSLPINENVVFSPISIHSILDMILMGTNASSITRTQLVKVLGYESMTKDIKFDPHSEMQLVATHLRELGNGQELILKLKDLLLVNKDRVGLRKEYVEELIEKHSMKIEEYSRSNADLKLDIKINDWISSNTAGKIKNMVTKNDIEAADAVFINAAYLKGKWLRKFKAEQTIPKSFYNHGVESQSKKVPFMIQTAQFGYASFNNDEQVPLDCQVLSMPFSLNEGQEMSMVFILPRKLDGLEKLTRSLNATILQSIYDRLSEIDVKVELPKFDFETSTDAKQVLQDMGLASLFEYSEDLSKMIVRPREAKVDKILHRSTVTVDEEGAEAAAATVAVVMVRYSLMISPQKEHFIADHPFLFVIRNSKSDIPLFIGQVVQFN